MKYNKRILLASLAIAGIFAFMLLVICLRNNAGASLDVLLTALQNSLICSGVCLVAAIPFSIIVYFIFCLLQSESIKTAIHLFVNKVTARQLAKNADVIYPCLQAFLYEVMKKNDILHIPIQDVSSVNCVGYSVKQDCVFYRYSINALDKPNYENDLLQKTLQSLIQNELKHYGIFGLSATYKSITALCYSVYADRVFYDEDNHALIIDVLYICTENSAKYYQNAIKRDNDNHNNMEDIYDDEV